jgi:hypothetical protein
MIILHFYLFPEFLSYFKYNFTKPNAQGEHIKTLVHLNEKFVSKTQNKLKPN